MSSTKAQAAAAPATATNGAAEWSVDPALVPNLDELVTEDGKPVDHTYVEKLYKLLIEPLYASWQPPGGRPFVALANVGWFHAAKEPPLVPDVLVSLDVTPRDPATREGRSYFQWILGKQPDVVVEVVSDDGADEPGERMRQYQRLGLPYYVIHDPFGVYDQGELRAFELRGRRYAAIGPAWVEEVGLGLRMWEGEYQGIRHRWLRWCDREGEVIPTGAETAARLRQEVDQTQAELLKLREQLRKLGVDPEA